MVRTLIQMGWFLGGYLALRLLVVALPVVFRGVRSLPARWRARRAAPALRLSLLVGVDEMDDSILPRVQLRGEPLLRTGKIRLELTDGSGSVWVASARELPPSAVGAELTLPPFFPPAGATLDEVLRWRWDVVIAAGWRRRLRWSDHIYPVDGLGPEAEIGGSQSPEACSLAGRRSKTGAQGGQPT